jgi:hypothetical protein
VIQYLSGCDNEPLQAVAFEHGIGLLVTPDTAPKGSKNFGYVQHIPKYPIWSGDNGCFAKPHRSYNEFISWLFALPRNDALFMPSFDVVGNAKATLERSLPLFPIIRALGFKPAYVAQDGIGETVVPWNEFDALFIGGSTHFKLSEESRQLVAEAKQRGKHAHMGRVNSFKRLKLADSWGCDSADGTYLQFTGPKGVKDIVNWLIRIREAKAYERIVAKSNWTNSVRI